MLFKRFNKFLVLETEYEWCFNFPMRMWNLHFKLQRWLYIVQAINYLLNISHCFQCRRERSALAISLACPQLSHRRPCSEVWVSALRRRNVIHVLQRGEGNKPKGRSRVRTEGERGTRLKDTKKDECHSLPVRQIPILPSSSPQNNDGFYHTFPIDFSSGEEMTLK